ncbi:hypothetical protein SUGI_0329120 [Cryptomeria japonica]|nr:hypothetical protein SUGI_0329120 [Cryptomeria japonica]
MAEKRIQAPSSPSKMMRVQVVKYVETLFVETDPANFKTVVQSLTGQTEAHLNASVLHHSHSFPTPHQEKEINVAEVEVKERAFEGFETETRDNGSADLLFWNYEYDNTSDLPPLTNSMEHL